MINDLNAFKINANFKKRGSNTTVSGNVIRKLKRY